eukprot:TRINITY_DN9691_c0_g1_i1.p1 TRINITY_DN9691_c0_g1~~TRINITY_DN9691_c0_g1_i1.p1  ORF type:complete len:418 (+),score=97.39 TRINITY_DN9691_c0_g1_i1:84-1256(+)
MASYAQPCREPSVRDSPPLGEWSASRRPSSALAKQATAPGSMRSSCSSKQPLSARGSERLTVPHGARVVIPGGTIARVEHAFYGSGAERHDVTAFVVARAKNGGLDLTVTREGLGVGGSTSVAHNESLQIVYAPAPAHASAALLCVPGGAAFTIPEGTIGELISAEWLLPYDPACGHGWASDVRRAVESLLRDGGLPPMRADAAQLHVRDPRWPDHVMQLRLRYRPRRHLEAVDVIAEAERARSVAAAVLSPEVSPARAYRAALPLPPPTAASERLLAAAAAAAGAQTAAADSGGGGALSPHAVSALVSSGYTEAEARAALRSSGGSLAGALQLLSVAPPPPPQQELPRYAGASVPCSGGDAGTWLPSFTWQRQVAATRASLTPPRRAAW